MKPSKAAELIILSMFGLIGLFCGFIAFVNVFLHKNMIVKSGTFLEFFTEFVGLGVLAILTIILIIAIISAFKVIFDRADKEWEESQINNKS